MLKLPIKISNNINLVHNHIQGVKWSHASCFFDSHEHIIQHPEIERMAIGYKEEDISTVKNKVYRKTYQNDAAGPVASKTRLFPSPFLRESGVDGGCLPSTPNFGV